MEIDSLIEASAALLKQGLGGALVSLVLYGSCARGTQKEGSDIDLLVVLEERPENLLLVLRKIRAFEAPLVKGFSRNPFSHMILSRHQASENRTLFLDMTRDARILYDKGDFFAGRLRSLQMRLRELGSKRVSLPGGAWYWDLKPDLKFGEEFEL